MEQQKAPFTGVFPFHIPSTTTDSGTTTTSNMLPATAKPPKSKTQPYYSVHPVWTDVEAIPQMDLDVPSTYASSGFSQALPTGAAEKIAKAGPALATIAYTPRYTEAMSYLRAVMAKMEYSDRALALTEDIIAMNPAHYTVWIYRFQILKELWGPLWTVENDDDAVVVNEKAKLGFEAELKWLERVSERNLKNYQIWHHRNSLFQLLPLSPAPSSSGWVRSLLNKEPSFLRMILALDTKNYHVWSYRQWLCAHFPDHFLTDRSKELDAMDVMIREDVMNNSAWNHRYFLVFGARKIITERRKTSTSIPTGASASVDANKPPKRYSQPPIKADDDDDDDDATSAEMIDLDIVDREVEYVKDKIRHAPQNGSSWNYLKGVLKYAGTPVTEMKEFCAEFVGDNFQFDTSDGDNGQRGVRSSQAVEMCVQIFAQEVEDLDVNHSAADPTTSAGDVETSKEAAKEKVRQALQALALQWDPIRRKYWAWRLDGYEKKWAET